MKFFTLIFLLKIILVFSQTSEEKYILSKNFIYLAKMDAYKKDYQSSNNRYGKAFKLHKVEDSNDLLDAASVAFEINNRKLAKEYIVEAIVGYNAPKEFVLEYKGLQKFKKDQIFTDIEVNYENYVEEYYKSKKSIAAYIEVEKLIEKDQNIRNLHINITKKLPRNIKDKKRLDSIFNQQMIEVDSITTNSLIEITKKYGYQDKGWIILWHQRGQEYKNENSKFWKFFKPLIKKEIENGNLHKSFFAMFDDEYEIINSGKQVYGTYSDYFEVYPIKDISGIDARLKQIGFPPLLYDKLIYGKKLPEGYTLTEDQLYQELLSRVKGYD
ncbi:hypothetical protein [Chryseobacterium sp. 3008163]|uniref:hypothetical protein n=1 Tax=Chryseobacterium sp. 3008163 TaxID=2478663 RepID=UPI000F0CBCC4|nr:hypothetical protein [Chryseobacterium sp. 3008163]AYN00933.1 hypothetical protein EAG08_12005 [Chryseobacterium sp. 3008163]